MDDCSTKHQKPLAESDLSRQIQVSLSLEGARLFRNNCGLFTTLDGRKIKTGLCNGSSDLIGWASNGRFLAIEVKVMGGIKKTNKKRLENQQNFINQVNKSGAIGFFAESVEEALDKYKQRIS